MSDPVSSQTLSTLITGQPQDAGAAYKAYREQLPATSAGDELLKRVQGAPDAAQGVAEPLNTAPTPGVYLSPRSAPSRKGAGSDIGRGIAESPFAIGYGIRDAVQNTINGAKDLGAWLEKSANLPGFKVDANAPYIHPVSGEELQGLPRPGLELPGGGEGMRPKTVTGGFVQGAAQFITSVAIAGKEFQAVGLPAELPGIVGRGYSAAKAFLGTFQGFDAAQERLSDLVQSFPVLRNPVTDFLSHKEDDSELTGRLKTALEATGQVQLLDGLVHGIRTLRGFLDAKAAIQGQAETAPATAPAARGTAPEAFQSLGAESQTAPLVSRAADIPRAEKLSPAERQVETNLANKIGRDPEAATAEYAALPESKGGKILNNDIARELSPEYAASKESRSTLSPAVHEPVSWFVKEMYAQKLKEAPAPGEDGTVLITAGGTGAGKTTAVEGLEPDAYNRAQIVYDTNSSSIDSTRTKIQQALDAGKKVQYVYVYRDPIEALTGGALPRAERMGRTVPLQNHAETHNGALKVVQQLAEQYKDNPNVDIRIIDNSLGKNKAAFAPLADITGKAYNVDVGELREALEAERQKGTISDATYRGTLGTGQTAGAAGDEGVGRQASAVAAEGSQQPKLGSDQDVSGVEPQDVQAARFIPHQPRGGETMINFARINSPEDIQNVTQQLADRNALGIKGAQRGTQSFRQISLNADQIDAWKALESRRTGEPLNAEQSVAVRQLWASSAEKLAETADAAASSPNEENLFAFRKMLATHYAIQNQVLGARTETARALASWRIPTGSAEGRLQQITDMLNDHGGGADVTRDLAQRISDAAKTPGLDNVVEQVVQKGWAAKTRGAVMAAWINGMLSDPRTQTKILASNISTTFWRMAERRVAEQISNVLGTQDGVAAGEAGAQMSGFLGGIRDSFAYASKAMRISDAAVTSGEATSPFATAATAFRTGVLKSGIGRPQEPGPNPISAEVLGLSDQGIVGKAVDFLGKVSSLGPRAIMAQHDMFVTFGYRMELQAQAVRQATAEVNAGTIKPEEFQTRAADLVANPPENMQSASADQALYQAFLDKPGQFAQWISEGTNRFPAMKVIQPFVKIVSRIFNYAFERTPLAPLMSEFRANIAAGGARRDLALAQYGLGSMISLAAADLTINGLMRALGPPEVGQKQAQAREGEVPFSFKAGDRWTSYYGVHPLGTVLGLAASTAEVFMNSQHELVDDADTEKIAAGVALAIAANVTNQSFMTGAANFFATMHDGSSGTAGGAGEKALQREVGTLIPGASAAAVRATDPYVREVYSMLDEFKSRIPGLSKDLPPKRDLWGEPVTRSSGMGRGADMAFQIFSPVQSKEAKHEPIDDEILRLGANITTPTRMQSFGKSPGARIDMAQYPQAYSRLLELAGNELKSPAWGKGAKDMLNDLVTGRSPLSAVYNIHSDGPEGGKEMMIRSILNQYRDLAKKQVLSEFPKLRDAVEQKQADARQLRMPVMQQ